MTFSSLWPLLFMLAVPLIIIIYMLRPKGKKMTVPSLMLWRNAAISTGKMSFVKKLLKNILMVLEIIIAILLILSLMSPFIRTGFGHNKKSTLIILDTSGSMKHALSNGEDKGKTRFDAAISEISDYAASSDGPITVMTCSSKASIVVANSTDKFRNRRAIEAISCTDTEGSILAHRGAIESMEVDNIIIYTDGNGADEALKLAEGTGARVRVLGEAVENVAVVSVTAAIGEGGLYDIAADLSLKGTEGTAADVSFYDAKDNLISVKSINLMPGQNKTAILKGVKVEGGYVRAEVSGMKYDSLAEDNTSYAVLDSRTSVTGYFIGKGNRYIETAYRAATGQEIIKAEDDSEIKNEENGIIIYDSGAKRSDNNFDMSCMIINKPSDDEQEEQAVIDGGYVKMTESELTEGLREFSFGAGSIITYKLPEWATEFMSVDGKTVGYYGIHDNKREIVIGFNIRNSEFPLMAEFPVFIANAVDFLSDNGFVGKPYISAGEQISISPTAGDVLDISYLNSDSEEKLSSKSEAYLSGLICCKADGKTEYLSVRFPAAESDGTLTSDGLEGVTDASEVSMSGLRKMLLIFAIILLIADWIIYVYKYRKFTPAAAVTRIVLTLLVILACIGISLPGRHKKTATIFVVDLSDSCYANIDEMRDYIREKIKDLPSDNEYAILTFGRDSVSEQFLTDQADFVDFGTSPEGSGTDIESAVMNAAAMIPDSYSGRIVILTDGEETSGDIRRTGELLSLTGIELDSVIFERNEKSDVYVSSAEMPEQLYPGDKYSLVVNIYSNYETDANVSVRQGSVEKAGNKVHLRPGNNTFLFSLTAGDDPIEQNDITVTAEGDEVSENNIYSTASSVIVAPKVLLISGLTQDSSGLKDILKIINQDVTEVSVINAPDTLEEMLKYKTIILDNCYKSDIPEGFLNNLSSYVKDYGGGLICSGGDQSFAPGGYRKTVLEEVLPVDMMPKGIDASPSMAMVMIIDVSGSMDMTIDYNTMTGESDGRTKLQIALAAAMGAVDNLMPDDYVGIVTFDDNFEWIQTIGTVDEVGESAKSALKNVQSGGGTVILPSVLDAINKISETDAGIKHILLLTDGEGETRDFSKAVELCTNNDVTLSTIAVGSDSDTELLESLAKQCGGRYYYSASASEVPRIFAEEVYMSGTAYFQKGEFSLSLKKNNELVKGLYENGTPIITQYISASAKTNATQVIVTDQDDPLLTCWQYGLGRTVAWQTTASGTWNSGFAGLNDYAEMWKRMVDYTCMDTVLSGDSLSVNKTGDKISIKYSAGDFDEDTEIEGVISSPSGESEVLTFTAESPGHYVSDAAPGEVGIYNINVRRKKGGEVVSSLNAISAVHFSDEYKYLSNDDYIRYINENGRILTLKDKVFGKIKVKKNGRRDITNILIILSILLLIFDIIVRRFNLNLPKLRRHVKKPVAVNAGVVNSEPVNAGVKGDETKEDAAAEVSMAAMGQANQPVPEMDKKAVKAQMKAAKKAAKKKTKQSQSAGLDTAQLLQKKQDRNDYRG